MRVEQFETSAYKSLIEEAIVALDYSYSPYSKYQVGAALLDVNDKVWRGCNIESVSYTPTSCGERTALTKAVSEGVREFKAIAIVGRDHGAEHIAKDFASPCGVCRQMLSEFATADFEFVLCKEDGEAQIWTIDEILPLRFTAENVESFTK